jgi:membrane-bound serine protease (ClpP class)
MAVYELLGALVLAFLLLWLVWKFLPKTPIYGRLVHSMAGAMPDPVIAGGGTVRGTETLPDVGARGTVVAPLHPLGEVEIDGVRYEASVGIGALEKGTPVVVTGYKNFCLLVAAAKDTES